jgi:hypothetical protein
MPKWYLKGIWSVFFHKPQTATTMVTSNHSDRRPIGWDPSNPSALFIWLSHNASCNPQEESIALPSSAPSSSLSPIYTLGADTGVVGGSCTTYELTALVRLIAAYETNGLELLPARTMQKRLDHHYVAASKNNSATTTNDSYAATCQSIRYQSQQYREAVQDCLTESASAIGSNSGMIDPMGWDLMSKIHSILRLSEIYLLPTSTWTSSSSSSSNCAGRDWLDCPGIATADTIRFLRRYELPPVEVDHSAGDDEDSRMDDDPRLQQQQQQHPIYPIDTDDKDVYWTLVVSLVRRGCLVDVWQVLQTHSLYRIALEGMQLTVMSDQDRSSSQSLLQDWEQIGSVLLTAPIPGGRSAEHDDETTSMNGGEFDRDDYVDLTHVNGLDVSRCDFKFWDIPSESDDGPTASFMGDYPIMFTPDAALQKYRLWREYVTHVRRTNRLCRQIPFLDEMFQMLCGDWTTNTFSFKTWSEQLCAELLYRTPDLRPRSIAARAAKLVKNYVESDDDNHAHPIVSIMQGNAGQAMSELYFLGGRSGAAVPTTVVSRYVLVDERHCFIFRLSTLITTIDMFLYSSYSLDGVDVQFVCESGCYST